MSRSRPTTPAPAAGSAARPSGRPHTAAVPAMSRTTGRPGPDEPVLEISQIQGNILAGFNKDYQTFLFLRITDATAARAWLQSLAPTITTTEEVLAFNRLYKALRAR